jgi:hypothetical protein
MVRIYQAIVGSVVGASAARVTHRLDRRHQRKPPTPVPYIHERQTGSIYTKGRQDREKHDRLPDIGKIERRTGPQLVTQGSARSGG